MSRPKYPLEVENGTLVFTTTEFDKARDNILSAVQTVVNERVMRPTYGRQTEPFDSYNIPDIFREFTQAITLGLEGQKGVEVQLSAQPFDNGELCIQIDYQISGVNTTIEVFV